MSFGKFLTIAIIVLTIVIGAVGVWYYQKNIYSKEILKLEIIGPEEVDMGEEVEYTVKYKNNGNVRVEEARLIFEYPKHSIPINQEALWVEKKLDDIYPGEEKTFQFRARILGREKEIKTARALLTYRPKNLKAFYDSETSFTTLIKFVPLTFEWDIPSKIEPEKDFHFRLNYFSNIDYPLSDLRAIVDYPQGFNFVDSRPKALDKKEWEIGLLNRAEGGRIEITGRVEGKAGDQKIFRAKLGSWKEGEFILFKEIARGVEITRPSLYLSQLINGNAQYTANAGDLLHYEIFFKNVGEEALTNLFLVAKLEGEPFDFESLKSNLGEFKSGDNSIIWDWKKVSQLQFLAPQQEGLVEFWIKLKEDWLISGSGGKNPVLRNKVYFSQVQEEFVTKVNSKIEIFQKGYFADEVFGNFGPLPPKVAESTTYTIIWQINNFYNDLRNVKVKTTLPREVRLTGEIFPKEANFAFDSQSREIVWEVGDIEAGAGINKPNPNIAFQISFTPSSLQRGGVATLIDETIITAEDTWTETRLEKRAGAIDTTLPDDETVTGDMGVVQ